MNNLSYYIKCFTVQEVIDITEKKDLKVSGYIYREGKKLKRDELPKEEQIRLAMKWNNVAMEAAGYTPVLKAQ